MVEGREKFLGGVTTLTRGKEIYNRGWYIIVCQMKASQSKSNFEKIRHYLTDKECVSQIIARYMYGRTVAMIEAWFIICL